MREIRFRGKSIYTKEWVYGDLIQSKELNRCVIISGLSFDNECDINPQSIGEFTGLYDKNGTTIYEGDIVKWGKDNKLYVVKFLKGMFYASIEECNKDIIGGFPLYVLTDADEGWCEIVGNIYDKPELLKK